MLAIFNCEADIKRIGKIKSPMPLYVWCYRENSATTNKDLTLKNMIGHFERNKYVSNSFRDRGHEDADAMVGRTMTDAYCSLTRKEPPEGTDELEKMIAKFYRHRKGQLKNLNQDTWQRVMKASLKEAKGSGFLNPDRPLFGDWLKELEHK